MYVGSLSLPHYHQECTLKENGWWAFSHTPNKPFKQSLHFDSHNSKISSSSNTWRWVLCCSYSHCLIGSRSTAAKSTADTLELTDTSWAARQNFLWRKISCDVWWSSKCWLTAEHSQQTSMLAQNLVAFYCRVLVDGLLVLYLAGSPLCWVAACRQFMPVFLQHTPQNWYFEAEWAQLLWRRNHACACCQRTQTLPIWGCSTSGCWSSGSWAEVHHNSASCWCASSWAACTFPMAPTTASSPLVVWTCWPGEVWWGKGIHDWYSWENHGSLSAGACCHHTWSWHIVCVRAWALPAGVLQSPSVSLWSLSLSNSSEKKDLFPCEDEAHGCCGVCSGRCNRSWDFLWYKDESCVVHFPGWQPNQKGPTMLAFSGSTQWPSSQDFLVSLQPHSGSPTQPSSEGHCSKTHHALATQAARQNPAPASADFLALPHNPKTSHSTLSEPCLQVPVQVWWDSNPHFAHSTHQGAVDCTVSGMSSQACLLPSVRTLR